MAPSTPPGRRPEELPAPAPGGATGGPGLGVRIFEPSPHVAEPGERIRARLLAAMVLFLAPVGMVSGAIQSAITPDFGRAYPILLLASVFLLGAYGLARSRWYRWGGVLAALVPIVVGASIGFVRPEDPIWYAFMTLGVLLATMFTTPRVSLAVASLGALGIAAVALSRESFGHGGVFVPVLMFYLGFSVVLLVVSVYRDRIDVARRRALMDSQAVLAHAQRMETVGQLAGSLAHDFNNLLAGLYGLLDAVEHGQARPEDAADLREMAERAAHLTRQLLDYGRPRPPSFAVVDAAGLVQRMEAILRRLCGPNVALRVHAVVEGPAPKVRVDPRMLEQAVVNLVANARDAVGQEGSVEVAVRSPEGEERVEIAVRDDGVGISEGERARIFEPFVSTKGSQRGTGLGLAMVQRVMQENGGSVELESEPGRGSTFRLILPRVEPDAEESGGDGAHAPALDEAEEGDDARRVLVVDDEPGVRRSVVRMLRSQAWQVDEAAGGEQALARVRDAAEPYHLLVTDVSMPGMDGGRLADAVKEISPRTRVLFISGRSEDALLAAGIAVNELNFLGKPFTVEALTEAARKLVP